MRCIRPIKASIALDGTITYTQRSAISGLLPFEFPCRKCLPCRLSIAREKAIRAVHEASIHKENIFLTLTYDEAHLESPRLQYEHFQTFMKDLRNHNPQQTISMMVTGEYGEINKRPHWHALLFNYRPTDQSHKYTTQRGEQVYVSQTIQDIWGKGNIEYGSITMDSAGYVARYAAKKLVHGRDQEHDFHPIHKTSSKHAIGKSWIQQNWRQTFNDGYIIIPGNKEKAGIPRYYVDWLKKQIPDEYIRYVTQQREETIKLAESKARKEEIIFLSNHFNYRGQAKYPLTRLEVKHRILNSKFKKLQEHLKL